MVAIYKKIDLCELFVFRCIFVQSCILFNFLDEKIPILLNLIFVSQEFVQEDTFDIHNFSLNKSLNLICFIYILQKCICIYGTKVIKHIAGLPQVYINFVRSEVCFLWLLSMPQGSSKVSPSRFLIATKGILNKYVLHNASSWVTKNLNISKFFEPNTKLLTYQQDPNSYTANVYRGLQGD